MEDDSKTYTDCIIALRKKAVDTEENCRGCCPLRRVAAGVRPETSEAYVSVKQDVTYLSRELRESFSPEQKKMYKVHFLGCKELPYAYQTL